MKRWYVYWMLLLLELVLDPGRVSPAAGVELLGAGASFPAAVYESWIPLFRVSKQFYRKHYLPPLVASQSFGFIVVLFSARLFFGQLYSFVQDSVYWEG